MSNSDKILVADTNKKHCDSGGHFEAWCISGFPKRNALYLTASNAVFHLTLKWPGNNAVFKLCVLELRLEKHMYTPSCTI